MLKAKIESILFIINRPLSTKKLAEILDAKKDKVEKAIDELVEKYNQKDGGIRILRHHGSVQMSTSPETAQTVQDFLKDETTGEMTKPSLETLTIIAYRGPITKAELEEIRGVNCSLILRNLMLRGLVEVNGEYGNPGAEYSVTMDFLRFLGVSKVDDLPEYEKLNSHENIVRILEQVQQKASPPLPDMSEGDLDETSVEDKTEDAAEGAKE